VNANARTSPLLSSISKSVFTPEAVAEAMITFLVPLPYATRSQDEVETAATADVEPGRTVPDGWISKPAEVAMYVEEPVVAMPAGCAFVGVELDLISQSVYTRSNKARTYTKLEPCISATLSSQPVETTFPPSPAIPTT
jgi:hypothetical protein